MQPFGFVPASSLGEAMTLARQDRAAYLAGGTDLLVKVKGGKVQPKLIIDLKRIPNSAGIEAAADAITIGALTTIRAIETSPMVKNQLPLLAQAAGKLGSVQVRHRATIGGNLCNAAPSAETAPALLCLDARVEIVSPAPTQEPGSESAYATRVEKLEDFFVGPGRTILSEGEILSQIIVPLASGRTGGVYYKQSTRRAMDIAFVGVAVYLECQGGAIHQARIALGAVAPTPIRAGEAEHLLVGQELTPGLAERVAGAAAAASQPISDLRASAEYRREMVKALTVKALFEAYGLARSGQGGGDGNEDLN